MHINLHLHIAVAWKRLIKGDYLYSDLLLLQHKYADYQSRVKKKKYE